MRKNIYALFAVMIFGTVSNSTNAVTVMGAAPCGVWIKDREAAEREAASLSSRTTERFAALHSQGWLVGFLSGIAIATNKDFLRATDSTSMSLWVDNYCRANPLKALEEAGSDLAKELIRQKGL